MYLLLGADGKEYGPAGASEVRQWLAQGRVHTQTLVRGPSGEGWKPLQTFPELLPPPTAFAPAGMPTRPRTNAMAAWGCAMGALSLCCCCCGCPFNLLAVIFSAIGLRQANQDDDSSARTLAIIGLICGLLSLMGSALLTLLSFGGEMVNQFHP